jgi:hypothetical protein
LYQVSCGLSPGIASYEIEYRDNSGDWQSWPVGSDPMILDADFTGNDGHTYTFRVRAYDNAGNEGAWSAEVETTIDISPPTSQASAPATSQTADFLVTWSGVDESQSPSGLPSGIVSYDVQFRDGDGAWTDWQMNTTDTSATFNGQMKHIYHFQSRARDLAGHIEAWPVCWPKRTSVRVPTKVEVEPLVADGVESREREGSAT